MVIPRTVFLTLTIYLVLAALSPGCGFFAPPAGASEPAARKPFSVGVRAGVGDKPGSAKDDQALERLTRRASFYIEHGKSKEALADLDAVIKARPTWRNYLDRANALLKCAPDDLDLRQKALLASKDCLTSLALQKNPLGYYLLAKAYLLAGPSHLRDALKASQCLVDASAGASDSHELRALIAFLAGDLISARFALAQYTADEVRLSHPESHLIIVGPVSQLNAKELAAIARDLPGTNSPKGPVRKMLLEAILDLFNKRFAPVTELSKRYKAAYGRAGFNPENDLALNLSACADLLSLHQVAAKAEVSELLTSEPIELSTLLLLDTTYYALNKREEGLKILTQHESRDQKNCLLSRARVLDDMAQPKEALEAIKLLAKVAPGDDEVLLQAARLESELNKNDDALEHLRLYIAKNPSAGQPYFMRAQIYAQKSRWEPASSDLTRAINAGYSLVKAVRARAGCYAALGEKGPATDDMSLSNYFTQWVR
jgi:hypothetical protein